MGIERRIPFLSVASSRSTDRRAKAIDQCLAWPSHTRSPASTGMDGFQWLREIRALEPDAGGSAVIAMIDFGPRIDRAHILNAGRYREEVVSTEPV
jgi:hypothetical protein